jgi:hypothetical protein
VRTAPALAAAGLVVPDGGTVAGVEIDDPDPG